MREVKELDLPESFGLDRGSERYEGKRPLGLLCLRKTRLHSALHHRTPKVGMPRHFIADDDQLQVLELSFLGQVSLQRRERFDNAYDVLVRAIAAGGLEQAGKSRKGLFTW